jgi:hypothetical protein
MIDIIFYGANNNIEIILKQEIKLMCFIDFDYEIKYFSILKL